MPQGRFWRVEYFRTINSGFQGIAEIEFRDTVGGADLTFSGMPILFALRPGAVQEGGIPGHTIDNDPATRYVTSGNVLGHVLTYDFLSVREVNEIAIVSWYDNQIHYFSRSIDGVTWHPVGVFILASLAGTLYTTGQLPDPSTFVNRSYRSAVRLNTSWPPGPFKNRLSNRSFKFDGADSGPLSISGTVAIDDTPDIPVRRRVRLHDKTTGRLVRETWSDPVTGAYAFEKLRDGLYYVTAFDHTGNHNAVIKDAIRPE